MLVPLRDHSSGAPSLRNAKATNIRIHVNTGPTRKVASSASAAATNGSHVRSVPLTRHTLQHGSHARQPRLAGRGADVSRRALRAPPDRPADARPPDLVVVVAAA